MSCRQQEHQHQHQNSSSKQVAPNAAKAVQYVCHLLRSCGIDTLTPEMVRQAKFDAQESSQHLLLALHDLALLVIAEFPPNCAEALSRLKQQLQQEALLEAQVTLPQQGRLLLLHCLSEWGCPAGLIAQLTLPSCSSRAALLALCWLIAHAQLFDRALEQMQLPQQLLPFLPPYPEDVSMTFDAQSQFHAAAAAAQQHHQQIFQLLQSQQQQQQQQQQQSSAAVTYASRSAGGSSSSSGSGWCAVQTAAHHVLASYRAATLRLQQLACVAEGREKQLHEIQQLQQQQQQQQRRQRQAGGCSSSSQASRSSPMRGNRQASPVLTAFELYLLSNPVLLQQHIEALQQAISCLQQQQECKQHAAVFFAWATSAISEAQQQLQGGGHGTAAAASHPGTSSSSSSTALQQQQQQRPQSMSLTFPAPPLQDVLSLVQQLPASDTALAAGVLRCVYKQLQQAAAEAGVIQLETDPLSSSQQQQQQHQQQQQCEGSSVKLDAVESAEQLGQALAGIDLDSRPEANMQGQLQAGHVAAFIQTAAAAIVKAGGVPDTTVQALQELPADIQGNLEQLQGARAEKADKQHADQAARQDMLAYSSLRREYQYPQQQQQQQQQQHGDRARLQDSSGVSGVHVPVAGELQRLNGVALHVAKLLAKTRAANKQQLAAAAQLLVEAGEAMDGGRLVVYQP